MLGQDQSRRFAALARLLGCAALTIALGCGADSATAPQPTIVGVYAMKTVNGQPLPFTMAEVGFDKIEVLSAAMTFTSEQKFIDAALVRVTHDGHASMGAGSDTGTYVLRGNDLTLTYPDGNTLVGRWDGAREVTLSIEGYSAIYRK